jgi:hypothetical protein
MLSMAVEAARYRRVRRGQPAAEVEPLVADGPAAQVLVDMSADADMLVVGSRGRGGFAGLLQPTLRTPAWPECRFRVGSGASLVRSHRAALRVPEMR